MKSYLLTGLIAGALAVPAFAATSLDTNGDGLLTLDEVQAVFPDITAEAFSAMDVNADGALDDNEVVAAQDAGMMPKS
jgi:Ca2+-binding EF-hand superfamily protein